MQRIWSILQVARYVDLLSVVGLSYADATLSALCQDLALRRELLCAYLRVPAVWHGEQRR